MNTDPNDANCVRNSYLGNPLLPGWKLRIGYAANFNYGRNDKVQLLRGIITFADQTKLLCAFQVVVMWVC